MTFRENTLKQTDLWPPLSQIQREIQCSEEPADPPDLVEGLLPSSASGQESALADADSLLSPLADWLRRRESASQARFPATWAPGVLVGVPIRGKLFGVLLDAQRADGAWEGWLTAPESDWAADHDVLLEPGDEPWEPLCGVVQAWNRVTVRHDAAWPVLGVLSALRLQAVRQVSQEARQALPSSVPPEPGYIALRSAGPEHTVLTGTPLSPDDVRLAYQSLYREVAQRLR